jgi:hypothetical protein
MSTIVSKKNPTNFVKDDYFPAKFVLTSGSRENKKMNSRHDY